MKSRVKLAFSVVAAVVLAAFFQIETSKADIIIPVGGCEYTGNPSQFCRVGDLLEVYNCVNNYDITSCGIEVEVIE